MTSEEGEAVEAVAAVRVWLLPGADRVDLAAAIGRALNDLRQEGKIERGCSVETAAASDAPT